MIPKMIHYCWFGGNQLSELDQKCIASWSKFCPNYEVKEWNERNFDLEYCPYVREAYEEGKWAFVADVVRLYALVNYGGIYMDTDVEVIRPLDELLDYESVACFESNSQIQTAFMASHPQDKMFVELLHEYDGIHFKLQDGRFNLTTNNKRITQKCMEYGLKLDGTMQIVNGFTILPQEYFSPKDWYTGEINITKHSYTIHHLEGSWLNDEMRLKQRLYKKLVHYLPRTIAINIAAFVAALRARGIKTAINELTSWVKRRI